MTKKIVDFARKYKKPILFSTICIVIIWWLHEPLGNFLEWISDRDALAEAIESKGNWGVVVYSLLLILQLIVAFIPGQALVFAGGYVFGLWKGLLVTIPIAVAGSQLAFLLARRYGRPLAYRLATQEAIDRWDAISKNQGILFYFLAFNLPIFPSDAMCYVAGLARISGLRFFIANLSGRLVSTFFTLAVGAYGFNLPSVFCVAAALVIIGFYFGWAAYARKHNINLNQK